jgi:hypothetical protein
MAYDATTVGHSVLLCFEVDDFDATVKRARSLAATVLAHAKRTGLHAMPDRRWNKADFERVVRSHELTDEALARFFSKRRTAEVRRLRDVLHTYHIS